MLRISHEPQDNLLSPLGYVGMQAGLAQLLTLRSQQLAAIRGSRRVSPADTAKATALIKGQMRGVKKAHLPAWIEEQLRMDIAELEGSLGFSLNPVHYAKKAAHAAASAASAVGHGAAAGVSAAAHGTVAAGRFVAHNAGRVGKIALKYNPVTLATMLAAAIALAPLRLAFRKSVVSPRAAVIARARGRKNPNAADKNEAIKWGFDKVKKMMPLKLGVPIVLALQNSRGVSLSDSALGNELGFTSADSQLGAFVADDVLQVIGYGTAALTAATGAYKALASRDPVAVAQEGQKYLPQDAQDQIDQTKTAIDQADEALQGLGEATMTNTAALWTALGLSALAVAAGGYIATLD